MGIILGTGGPESGIPSHPPLGGLIEPWRQGVQTRHTPPGSTHTACRPTSSRRGSRAGSPPSLCAARRIVAEMPAPPRTSPAATAGSAPSRHRSTHLSPPPPAWEKPPLSGRPASGTLRYWRGGGLLSDNQWLLTLLLPQRKKVFVVFAAQEFLLLRRITTQFSTKKLSVMGMLRRLCALSKLSRRTQ